MQEEFGKIKVLITKSTYARWILKPQSVIPRESDFLIQLPPSVLQNLVLMSLGPE